ncbi:glycosyltransferase family 2 protein [Erythrobacter sp. NE805]|uniref:glycosyltransferase family 2 protein n=1 Tax=Erythrobacter sp. NE805 TaxID=3389875 RepID=UPI00396B1540
MTRTATDAASLGSASLASGKTALIASIVITTYRRQAILGELLEALCPQLEGRSVEVLVVDNCPAASARDIVEACRSKHLRYEQETRTGVVHARNHGVREARGTYVIFLDDDELPGPGWLDAWLAQADGRTDASFARIVPRLLSSCPPGLSKQVARNFVRDMRRETNADVSARWPYLGTGNAMFHKRRCLGEKEPFDTRFNARGGEDVWLIRSLVRRGHRLIWNAEAVVEEVIPEERMTLSFLELRRFNQGQIRSILAFGGGGVTGMVRASTWMLMGGVQFLLYRTAAAIAGIAGADLADHFRCEAGGGLGKLLWWSQPRVRGYARD